MKNNENILVTGANGFLGSALVRLLKQHFNVKTLVRKTSDLTNLKGQDIEISHEYKKELVRKMLFIKRSALDHGKGK